MQYVQPRDSGAQLKVTQYTESLKSDIHTDVMINSRKTFITKHIYSCNWNAQEKIMV